MGQHLDWDLILLLAVEAVLVFILGQQHWLVGRAALEVALVLIVVPVKVLAVQAIPVLAIMAVLVLRTETVLAVVAVVQRLALTVRAITAAMAAQGRTVL
jgi:hypothetical protein